MGSGSLLEALHCSSLHFSTGFWHPPGGSPPSMITPTLSSLSSFSLLFFRPHSNPSFIAFSSLYLLVFLFLHSSFGLLFLFELLLLQFLLPSWLCHQYFSSPLHFSSSHPIWFLQQSYSQSILQTVVQEIRPTVKSILQNVSQADSVPEDNYSDSHGNRPLVETHNTSCFQPSRCTICSRLLRCHGVHEEAITTALLQACQYILNKMFNISYSCYFICICIFTYFIHLLTSISLSIDRGRCDILYLYLFPVNVFSLHWAVQTISFYSTYMKDTRYTHSHKLIDVCQYSC